MFQFSAATKIHLAAGVTDLRKSFDTLSGVVRSWQQNQAQTDEPDSDQPKSCDGYPDPLDGHLFIFCNRRRDRIKVLYFDGTSLWVCASRLEVGTYSWPQATNTNANGQCSINHQELALLLGGVDMSKTKRRRWWRRP